MSNEPTYLTTRAAARRVGRSVRSIRRWRRQGMKIRMDGRRMEVELEELLTWWREMTFRDPATQYRIRRRQKELSGSS